MSIHSPACKKYLAELLTAPTDSADHQIAGVVGRLSEPKARDYLLTLIDEDHGTRPAEIALKIWHLADTNQAEEAQR